ncbi:hypothetical protein [Microbulbifer sp. DLAB2-AA]|uniref:hypothetical protein n=1 Tax=Microbulbifer sp. DLAB2-AA TaxID=3243394 RepID=UPI0040398332
MFEAFKKHSAATRIVEEQLYEIVVEELAQGLRRNGLWAKAVANANGQDEKAKALYIQYRVQSLKDELELARQASKAQQPPPQSAFTNNATPENFNPEPSSENEKSTWIHTLVWTIGGLYGALYISGFFSQ